MLNHPPRLKRLLATLGVVALLFGSWTTVAGVIGPHLIAQGYAGRSSIGALNNYFDGKQASVALDAYVEAMGNVYRGGILLLSACGLALLAVWADQSSRRPRLSRLVGETTPTQFGVIRTIVCGIALMSLLLEDPASTALLPRSMINLHQFGFMELLGILPGWDRLLASAAALTALKSGTAVLLACGMLGLGTRVVLPLALFGYFLVGGILRIYTHYFHTGVLAIYLIGVLSLAPSGDGFSIDRLIRIARGRRVPPAERPSLRYGWARYGCWAVIALTYFAAGTSKIRDGGWFWWQGTNILGKLLKTTLGHASGSEQIGLIVQGAPDAFFAALGLGTLTLEIGMILVLFSRRARSLFPPLIALMHVGMFVLIGVRFLDLIVVQLVFVDWTKWSNRLRERLRGYWAHRFEPHRAHEPRAGPGWLPSGVTLMFIGYLFVIVYQLESYPLSAWQMFSDRSTTIYYYAAFSIDESSRRVPLPFEEVAGVLVDHRQRDVMMLAFDPRRQDAIEDFLRLTATQQNEGAPPGGRVVRYDIERWLYDLAHEPDERDRVRLDRVYSYQVEGR